MTTKRILQCRYCGNKTPMKALNKYEEITSSLNNMNIDMKVKEFFEVLKCLVCNNNQVYHGSIDINDGVPVEEIGEIIFPEQEKIESLQLPEKVRKAYESALDIREKDSVLCAIALRRTLELMCKDKEAEGSNLYKKLMSLKDKGILPPLIGDISLVVKDFGNMAAHGDDFKYGPLIATSMLMFTNKILEYVYILPLNLKPTLKL